MGVTGEDLCACVHDSSFCTRETSDGSRFCPACAEAHTMDEPYSSTRTGPAYLDSKLPNLRAEVDNLRAANRRLVGLCGAFLIAAGTALTVAEEFLERADKAVYTGAPDGNGATTYTVEKS